MDAIREAFNECCPWCGTKITNLYDYHEGHNYETHFTIECNKCLKNIDVTAHEVVEFEMHKVKL